MSESRSSPLSAKLHGIMAAAGPALVRRGRAVQAGAVARRSSVTTKGQPRGWGGGLETPTPAHLAMHAFSNPRRRHAAGLPSRRRRPALFRSASSPDPPPAPASCRPRARGGGRGARPPGRRRSSAIWWRVVVSIPKVSCCSSCGSPLFVLVKLLLVGVRVHLTF